MREVQQKNNQMAKKHTKNKIKQNIVPKKRPPSKETITMPTNYLYIYINM